MANQALPPVSRDHNTLRHQNDNDISSPGSNSSAHSSTANRMTLTLPTRGNVLPSGTSIATTPNPPAVQRTAATPPPHQLQGTLDKIIASVNVIQAEQKRPLDQLMQS